LSEIFLPVCEGSLKVGAFCPTAGIVLSAARAFAAANEDMSKAAKANRTGFLTGTLPTTIWKMKT
jgi:hypothetical protein